MIGSIPFHFCLFTKTVSRLTPPLNASSVNNFLDLFDTPDVVIQPFGLLP